MVGSLSFNQKTWRLNKMKDIEAQIEGLSPKHRTEAKKLLNSLSHIVKEDELCNWLQEPNPAFADEVPITMILADDMSQIWMMAYDLSTSDPC